MPVQIGEKNHSFSDPLGLLSDCHRRIEMFLGSLQAVARTIEYPPTDEIRQALETALRYFSQAAPKHTADEEESLFPRMRQCTSSAVETAFAQLGQLEADHERAAVLHGQVERLGEQYLSAGHLAGDRVALFRQAIADLSELYEKHIRLEDNLVFPLASRVLSEEETLGVGREMAQRRKTKLTKFTL